MVRKPGSKHSVPSSRVTARRNDWNSIRDLHQGPRSKAAFRGRIHDRSRFVCRNAKKSLPRGGRPYMTGIRSQTQHHARSFTGLKRVLDKTERGCKTAPNQKTEEAMNIDRRQLILPALAFGM